MLLRPLDNGVQSTVAADPAEGAPHDPGDFGRDKHAVATAGNRLDASPRGTLLRVSPARFDATVECAGTPALPCPSDLARGVSLASASAERYVDKAMSVLADASKAMEITIDVDRDMHVNPAARLGVDTAALDVIANALPGYSVEDRMRLVKVVEAQRVESRGALPCSPGRSATTPQAFPRSLPSHWRTPQQTVYTTPYSAVMQRFASRRLTVFTRGGRPLPAYT